MKSKVVIWNSHKLGMGYNGDLPTNTYAAVLEYERSTGNSLSSIIEVDSLEQLNTFIEGVYNETDVLLNYQFV